MNDQSAAILAENPCEATRLAGMTCIKTETAMSRQEADLIAVLIFTYDSTRLLIHLVEPQFGTNPSGVFPI